LIGAYDQSVPGVFRNGIDLVVFSGGGEDDSFKDGTGLSKEAVIRTNPNPTLGILKDRPNVRIIQATALIKKLNPIRGDVKKSGALGPRPERLIPISEKSRQIARWKLADLSVLKGIAVCSVKQT
jgi:hypothetical protein